MAGKEWLYIGIAASILIIIILIIFVLMKHHKIHHEGTSPYVPHVKGPIQDYSSNDTTPNRNPPSNLAYHRK